MAGNFLFRHKQTILYSAALAGLLLLLKWLEWRFVVINYALEIYISAIAVIFTGLGIWLTLKLTKPKIEQVIVEQKIYINAGPDFIPNETAIKQLGLSKRELEVLQLMAKGNSNQEIAGQLFLSLNTVKTHAAKLFEKLAVARRTQAVDKAKNLGILP